MKRILCVLLSALLLLTLTACGGKKPAEDPTAQPPVEQPDTPDPPDPPAPSEAEQVVAPGGWDIYCIVPADENADVAVNEYGWLTEGAELPEAGELLYHGSGAAPVYLIANESDIMPNTQVTVTAADGTAVIYQPFLSLRDGSLAVPEDGTVYDFTVYPEGFVRETTA